MAIVTAPAGASTSEKLSTIAQGRNRGPGARFAVEVKSPSESELDLAGAKYAETDELWQQRQSAIRELEAARVAHAASTLPDNVAGVRFVERDGKLIAALYIPATSGGTVEGMSEFHDKHLDVITALANSKSLAVELEPTYEKNGRQAWDWKPDAIERATSAGFAETREHDALETFHELHYDYNTAAADYLAHSMPDGVERVQVMYDQTDPIRPVPVIVAAFDDAGREVHVDWTTPANANYRVTVARTDTAYLPVTEEITTEPVFEIQRGVIA